ncbi:class I SAM-dependent methyltransferase [Aliirhizobium terrae]|uniref:class I SAM-dependent methyltransferase n=1 Tax=Terrirhizobium terrae TaxID=2926709 RepID=UPI002574EAE0|nr:class I SAM-dependent methyltransferase [Rhizobium sp. CC-CFT758]WJH41579.1 class I SAM-dependent methyltransferase [Rhizobium sp. CC-CFT758]
MSFDPHWLSLREPADGNARDRHLLLQAKEVIEKHPGGVILDIGCGSGSTYRSLQPHLHDNTRWRLLDNDRALLDEVRNRHGDAVETIEMDLGNVDALPLHDVALVTASALFDLCSAQFIDSVSRRLGGASIGLYAALNYDGEMDWTDEHPLDRTVTAAFNAHQQSDKGFGLSLGPDAWQALADAMRLQGSDVTIAESPWMLGDEETDLQLLLLSGIASAVQEHGQREPEEVISWYAYRQDSAREKRGLCRIGHRDLIAVF